MAGKPIPVGTANDMITAYIGFMEGLGVDMNNQTQSVSFTGSTVMTWLNSIMPRADELKIFMGMYLPGHVKAGHTTVILWPYKNGQPVQSTGGPLMLDGAEEGGSGGGEDDGTDEPFNDGSGQP